jgi:DNA-directed RNA polymerase subunit K/omega
MSYFENDNNIDGDDESDYSSIASTSYDDDDDENNGGGVVNEIVDDDDDDDDDIIGCAVDDDDIIGGGADDEDNDDDDININITNNENVMYNQVNEMDENYDSDEDDELYLTKFDKEINKNYLLDYHPECVIQNYDEIVCLSKVVRDKNNIIIDDLHKTIPYLTKYERTRILGQRAKQINSGASTFVKAPENVVDGYLIAELELKHKRIPFIIRRPLPNGASEFWCVKDLENISF